MSKAALELEGVVNIAKAEGVFHQMEGLFQGGSPVTIQASEVTKVDTSTLQLIACFIASMQAGNFVVDWGGVSDELLASAKLLGMEKSLNL